MHSESRSEPDLLRRPGRPGVAQWDDVRLAARAEAMPEVEGARTALHAALDSLVRLIEQQLP